MHTDKYFALSDPQDGGHNYDPCYTPRWASGGILGITEKEVSVRRCDIELEAVPFIACYCLDRDFGMAMLTLVNALSSFSSALKQFMESWRDRIESVLQDERA